MKVLGIIAEYNPFHNGHLHHLNTSIKITNADYKIALISGSFSQRAETPILSKWDRANLAIANGIDLVIELPTVFASSAAEDFAYGSIKLLKELGVVNYLSFGSGIGNIEDLEIIADIFNDEPEDFVYYLNQSLQSGMSYPKALNEALNMYTGTTKFSDILAEPNNVLGIEYIKQIKKQNFNVAAITVARKGSNHHDEKVVPFASGTAIRQNIDTLDNLKNSIPNTTFNYLKTKKIYNTNQKELFQMLLYKIRTTSIEELSNIYEVNEGLENKIKKASYISTTYEELIQNIKSKRYTESKIRRIFKNILLDITKKDMIHFKKIKPYARILGFNTKGKELISIISKANPKLDIVISVNDFEKNIFNKDKVQMLQKDILATDISSLSTIPYDNAGLDYTTRIKNFDSN